MRRIAGQLIRRFASPSPSRGEGPIAGCGVAMHPPATSPGCGSATSATTSARRSISMPATWCWWGRTGPARPICSKRSRCSRPTAACAARRFETLAAQGSDGAWAVAATIETPDGPADIGTGASPGETGRRVRINGANARAIEEMSAYLRAALAHPGHGRAVLRPGQRPPPLPRPAGDDADPRPLRLGRRLRQGHAPAQPAARGGRRPAAGSRRSRRRWPSTPAPSTSPAPTACRTCRH